MKDSRFYTYPLLPIVLVLSVKKIQSNGIHITTSEYPCYALHLCVTYGSGFLWLPVHDLIGISARRDGIGIECYAHMQNAMLKRM